MPRIALVALLIALVAVPGAAAAATAPPPPLRNTTAFAPSTDGRAVAAWRDAADGRVVHVLRDDQRAPATVTMPPGCEFGATSATALAAVCTGQPGDVPFGELRLLDPATGATVRTLALARLTANRAGGEAYYVTALGSALAVLEGQGNHVLFDQYVRVGDGTLADPGPADPRTATDLDAPSGRTPLCAPLRRLSVHDPYRYRAPWLLTIHGGRALLSRCGSARRRDLGAARADRYTGGLVLTARYVAWSEPRGVAVRRLAGGPTFHYRASGHAHLAGTDHRLWMWSDPHAWTLSP